ncbi:MAG: hypothetical protein QOJ21_3926, partial [Solirubrobacteraceae bacterium]|nr:hypothetical protein [Solirubrobacteraceae bacterium]
TAAHHRERDDDGDQPAERAPH